MDAHKSWVLKRVALMTVMSIVGSVCITFALMYLVMGSWHGIELAVTIAVIAPAVVAPLGTYQYISLSHRLHQANEKLRVLSEIDSLTNTLNRRTFMEIAEKHLALAARHRYPTSLIVLDFDHFKQVNDRYGHAVGDKVLVETVDIIKEAIRETDVLARIGGEEFILLLPHTAREGAAFLAERILTLVNANQIATDQEPLSVTLTMGGSTCATSETPLDDLMSSADKLLYAAKQAGRNRFMIEARHPVETPSAFSEAS